MAGGLPFRWEFVVRVLLVDDDAQSAAPVAEALTNAGHDLRHVSEGAAALAAALTFEPDLLISEVALPDLGGPELIRALKAQSPHLPVIVISRLSAERWAGDCAEAGADLFLEKPADIADILREVHMADMGRVRLRAVVFDTAPYHAMRTRRALADRGCAVTLLESTDDIDRALSRDLDADLWLIDVDVPVSAVLLAASRNKGVVVAFGEQITSATEDRLMRAGVALCMRRPLDVEHIMTQAMFLGLSPRGAA